MTATNLAHQVVSVTEEYLGPAAERFISRLIRFHLDKEPNELDSSDIPKLSEWVKVSLGLLTEDKATVDECERKILSLSQATEKI